MDICESNHIYGKKELACRAKLITCAHQFRSICTNWGTMDGLKNQGKYV